MTSVISTHGLQPMVEIGTTDFRVQWNEREARILASIRLGIEQATRGEGTMLMDDDLTVDDA